MPRLCPLCESKDSEPFYQDKHRSYFQCDYCELVFVPPEFFLSSKEEKTEYDLHQNSPDDPEYRKFLSRIFNPVKECLKEGDEGLDFGSGPGPTLSIMFEEVGYPMNCYDYFYANDPTLLQRQYDFITATEVVEHLHDSKKELNRLWSCLKPGGLLGIMTKVVPNREAFADWHYKNDRTHVCFFSRATFEWLAKQWGASVTFIDKDVIIFR